jgi:hypothetical protein
VPEHIHTGEARMHTPIFSFGTLRIGNSTYEQDVGIGCEKICKRKKMPSRKFRDELGHTLLSIEER